MVVGVKFSELGKSYNFLCDLDVKENDKVIVETERGLQLGLISEINVTTKNKDLKDVKSIATDKEYDTYLKNIDDAKEALEKCKNLIEKLKLDMNVIDASYSLDKKILLFNFYADERVDFRELVKELATIYHTRIELHQIGIRDKAKIVGGIGMCGRTLCCYNHLRNIDTVNINMVKNQNIALNPTKINGACGRLLCCFNYENEVYTECRKNLPKVKDIVDYKGKKGEVVSVDILKKKYTLKFEDEEYKEVEVK